MPALRTIAIISDTHLPRGRRRLPDDCVGRLRAADLIIHAGDVVSAAVWEELGAYGELAGVRGNVDDAGICGLLPDRLELRVGDVRLGVLHDGGPARGRLQRLRRAFPGAHAVVFGHSHIPVLETDPSDGFQIFNPGSPTDKRREPRFTMGWAEVSAGKIAFALIQLS